MVVELKPRHDKGYTTLSRLLIEQGRLVEARQILEEGIKKTKSNELVIALDSLKIPTLDRNIVHALRLTRFRIDFLDSPLYLRVKDRNDLHLPPRLMTLHLLDLRIDKIVLEGILTHPSLIRLILEGCWLETQARLQLITFLKTRSLFEVIMVGPRNGEDRMALKGHPQFRFIQLKR